VAENDKDNGDQEYNWGGILAGYILIGVVGSLAIVVGAVVCSTVRLEKKLVETFGRIDPPPTLPPHARRIPPGKKPALEPTRWAIVKTPRTKCYSKTGKYVKRVTHGTVVGICRIKENTDGDLALCRISNGAMKEDVYMRTRDLSIQSGPLTQASEAEKTLRIRKVQIEASIDERLARQLKQSPYYQEYRDAYDAYVAYGAEVTTLRARLKTSRGAEHMEISDQLRQLKNDGVPLKIAHDQAKKRLMRWRDRQAAGLSSDPTTRRLQSELAQVEEQIRRIEQGL